LEVDGVGTFDVEEGKRLVLAIEEEAGVDIMHACGSYAKCTTCRVEFLEGEPEDMTEAEMMILDMRQLLEEARLSCQIYLDHDMKVRPLLTVSGTGADNPGAKPQEEITPEPIWIERPYLRRSGKRGSRLPRDPGSLIISTTKGRKRGGPASKRGRR
jgi:ferredoxin